MYVRKAASCKLKRLTLAQTTITDETLIMMSDEWTKKAKRNGIDELGHDLGRLVEIDLSWCAALTSSVMTSFLRFSGASLQTIIMKCQDAMSDDDMASIGS